MKISYTKSNVLARFWSRLVKSSRTEHLTTSNGASPTCSVTDYYMTVTDIKKNFYFQAQSHGEKFLDMRFLNVKLFLG